MFSLVYENEFGQVVNLGNEAPFFFISQQGLDGHNATPIMSKSPFQKGKTIVGVNIDERVLGIRGCLVTENAVEFEESRAHLVQVFSPLASGNLFILGKKVRKMFSNVRVIDGPNFEDRDHTAPDGIIFFTVTIVVSGAYLEDVEGTLFTMFQVDAGFSFPLMFEDTIEFGNMSFGAMSIVNDGDVDTPIKIEIPGYVETPMIVNESTGKFIRVNVPIAANEVMHINTGFGNKIVEIIDDNGNVRNAFHYIDLKSTFFSLKVGENNLRFSCEAGNDTASIMIYYKRHYLGM